MATLAPTVLSLLPSTLLWTLMLVGCTMAPPMAVQALPSGPLLQHVDDHGDVAPKPSPVFPLPRNITLDPAATQLTVSKNVSVVLDASFYGVEITDTTLVNGILSRYQQLLRSKVSWSGAEGSPSRVAEVGTGTPALTKIAAKITGSGDAATELGPETDESYSVAVTTDPPTATVTAATAFGLRHGLETLAQLVVTPHGTIQAPVTISDHPQFAYRGLMIDTGRHFLSTDTIKRAINGMATMKLNVLHWHILDSSSFPVKSLKFPQLSAKGAYSPAATYSLDELRELVAFAKGRGVRIVVEIEMPGHGSFSAGMPELSLTSCDDVLDPTKDSTYKFLGDFLQEMTTVFTDSLLYLGGDEVGFDPKCKWPGTSKCGYHCFDRDPAVAAWMKTQGMNSTELLDYFWKQVTKRVVPLIQSNVFDYLLDRRSPNGAGGPEHVWPPPHMSDLPTGAIANVYQSMATAGPILDAGSPVVLSIAGSDWYLDYHPSFEDVYKVVPCAPSALDCASKPNRRKLLLGGSVSQWGESVDAFNFDADVWVGASALAERLWSDPPLGDNATLTSKTAQDRHHALSCHWKMWGVATYTRLGSHSEDTQVKDASLGSLCPADWSTPPV